MVLLFVGLLSCRKEYRATEVDLANYGWKLFEESNYIESNRWFLESVVEDSAYKDGYNGIGWSFGKLINDINPYAYLDSSVYYFQQGLMYTQNVNILADVHEEMLAGLCFAYNARGEDSLSLVWADSLTANWTEISTWSFSHDTTLNHLDVYIAIASSYFGVGDFTNSLGETKLVMNILTPGEGTNFNPDINTVIGRDALAAQIKTLQTYLK